MFNVELLKAFQCSDVFVDVDPHKRPLKTL